MERQHILHMFTPGRQMSPFDVNMAVDAGYQVVVPYTDVDVKMIGPLTQDAIFSRGPKGVAHTGIFIGGRDVMLATDMLRLSREAMVPPFEISVFADPSGSFTTAAALVASVESQLRSAFDTGLDGKHVLVFGGTGPVGLIAGVLAVQAGARVSLASSRGLAAAHDACERAGAHFGTTLEGADASTADALDSILKSVDVVFATAAAGVEVMSTQQVNRAARLLVAADVNAVPPAGIAGVGVMDNGKRIGQHGALGIGALAIGNVKYEVQQRLFMQMLASKQKVYLGFEDALEMARRVVSERSSLAAA
ncbi:NAD(P)-dependent methylenetetrahydromethanopterin dehydrogenase [Paraburkholderia diazotrophica]|uniref:Methylene-tetrahydromethanopterin dehydrogenase n=1 Tax=Paraburkholderia diazotrophica TaxID=667676 RepID=A0A1H6YGB4_9BURK|nr:NAD(P)-dependent methylenetetrahydromethanopterin dehydrogenase [Paraburkholderia diazotrophica]SEJ38894.1 methylene-tetrahydromethanopterin dehydrogenase [Paraburkholderia diazotrophica]